MLSPALSKKVLDVHPWSDSTEFRGIDRGSSDWGKRMLVALLLLSSRCHENNSVLWLFLKVPWVGLQYFIVVLTIGAIGVVRS